MFRIFKKINKKQAYDFVVAIYCDYGMPYGKGKELKSYVESCSRKNLTCYFFSRDLKGILGNSKKCYFLKLISKFFAFLQLLNFNKSRLYQEKFFDFYISWLVPKSRVLITTNGMHLTINKALRQNSKVYIHNISAPYEHILNLINKFGDNTHLFNPDLIKWYKNKQALTYMCHSESCHNAYKKYGYINTYFTDFVKTENLLDIKYIKKKSKITRFLFIGNVTTLKGCKLLLDYWSIFANDQELELHFVGHIYSDIKDYLKSKSFFNVFFWGYQKETKYFYQSFDFFIFFSFSEGGARVLAEALSYNLTLILGSFYDKTIYSKAGHIVSTKKEFKFLIDRLKKNKRRKIIKNFTYNWDNITNEFVEMINNEILH